MKLSCTTENFQRGLTIVLKAVALRPTLPVLTHVLLSTEKGRLKIVATDLEISITTWIGAKITEEGSIAVPARVITEYIQSIRDPTVNLLLEDNQLKISSERFQAEIHPLAAAEFPIIPAVKPSQTLTIPALSLKEGIRQTLFSTAIDETRPVLTALALRFGSKGVKLVATDSFRLAEKTITSVQSTTSATTLLIPTKTAHELERLLDSTIEQAEFVLSENQSQIRLGNIEIVSRLIDGQYPEYEAVIPKDNSSSIVIETQPLVDALKTSLIFAREASNQVALSTEQDQNQILFKAQSSQLGGNTATLPAEFKGQSMTISFNARYMLDVLGVIATDKVVIGLSDPTKPIVIKPEPQNDYLAVIMPLKTS